MSYLAEKLDMSESGLRHWFNGNRNLNLEDFFILCDLAKAGPMQVLFGTAALTAEQKTQLGPLITSILEGTTTAQLPVSKTVTKAKSHR